jgi:type IV pilus assembly protein PilN
MTPIRINLLPHREMRRARQQRLFALLAVATVVAAVAIVAAGHMVLMGQKANQDERNALLQQEIVKLDAQIAEIRELREKTQDLLARKDVVESLQSNRGEAVRLFDELVHRIPDGLYLKSVKQTGDQIALSGYAQSSARVSSFMRALNDADLFAEPVLVEVKAARVGPLRVNEFALNVKIERRSEEDADTAKAGG